MGAQSCSQTKGTSCLCCEGTFASRVRNQESSCREEGAEEESSWRGKKERQEDGNVAGIAR